MPFLAIEFNADHMLVVATTSSSREFEIANAVEIPVDADATAEEIGGKLKVAVEQHNWSRHEAIVVLSRAQSELREMTVPPAPDDELPDMVKFKARSDFASLNENWLLDYVPLSHDVNVPRKVLASAISPKVADRARSVVELAGLKLKQLVLRPYATLDLLRTRFKSSDCRLIIDPNCNSIDLTIVEGKKLVATRTVRVPDSFNDNERANQLISEVRRTLASSKRSMGGKKIVEVILCDDPTTNKHLSGDLTKRLELPVSFIDPFKESNLSGVSRVSNVDRPYLFTSVLGSMSQMAAGDRPEIDFVNPRRPAVKEVNRDRYYLYGGLAALAALMMVFFAWWTLSSQSSRIENLKQQASDARKLNQGNGIVPPVDETLAVVGKIDKWKKADVNWLDELDELSKRYLTADETIVASFEARVGKDRPKITIKGKVDSGVSEKALVSSLTKPEDVQGQPFQRYSVTEGTSGNTTDDEDYSMTFNHTMTLEDDDQFIWQMNKRANEFLDAKANE
jgi:Tfp pilus assembly PilM family ATPase